MKKMLLVFSYFTMIILNALANIIPIGGENTGAISDSYQNLFAPAGFTFAIWGIIYLLLGVMLISMLRQKKVNNTIALGFIISSFANAVWILAWHYRFIGISVIIMLVILISLVAMMRETLKENFPKSEVAFIKPPIGVYLGWITVATVANITTFLVDIGWDRMGLSEATWMMIILVVAAVIGCAAIRWSRCGAYGLVIIWAYAGIFSKHTAETGFDRQYGGVLMTLYVTLFVVVLATGYTLWKTLKTVD